MSELLETENLLNVDEIIDKEKAQRTINFVREKQQEKKEQKKQQVFESLQKGKQRRQFVIENEHVIKKTKHKANRLFEQKLNEKKQLLVERAEKISQLLDSASERFDEKRKEKKVQEYAEKFDNKEVTLPGFDYDPTILEEVPKTQERKTLEDKFKVNSYRKKIATDIEEYNKTKTGVLELTEEERLFESISIKIDDLEKKVGQALRYGLMETNYGSGIARINDADDLDKSNQLDGHTVGWNATTQKYEFKDFFTISAVAADTTTGIVTSFSDLTLGSNVAKEYDGRITITVGGSQYYVGIYNIN